MVCVVDMLGIIVFHPLVWHELIATRLGEAAKQSFGNRLGKELDVIAMTKVDVDHVAHGLWSDSGAARDAAIGCTETRVAGADLEGW